MDDERMNEMNAKEFEDKLRTERTLLENIKKLGVSDEAKELIDQRIADINATLGE